MQKFTYKLCDNNTYAVVGYEGDEPNVKIPDTFLGRPISMLFDCLFRYHSEIETVEVPDTVIDFGEFLFEGCEKLHYIQLPSQLESIWPHSFVRSGIEEITIPEHVRTIASFAFKDCKNLRKVVCSPSLKRIQAWAFHGCDNLTECIYGPNTEVDPRAFERLGK